jgi:hypothetical protein
MPNRNPGSGEGSIQISFPGEPSSAFAALPLLPAALCFQTAMKLCSGSALHCSIDYTVTRTEE